MRSAWLYLFLLAGLPVAASAQTGDPQLPGERLFRQHCSVCHLKPSIVNNSFGPTLSKETVEGKEAAVKEFIAKGTPRMPGFQYTLQPTQVDAVIAYLKTVATPAAQPAAAPARPAARAGMREDD
jgi:mono/diheme cytochrome c family protein